MMPCRRAFVALIVALAAVTGRAADGPEPLEVLLVAGGCCHDYATQTRILKEGIEDRLNAHVTIAYSPDKTTSATFEIYEKDDWAANYDVVIHDECSANVTDKAYVGRILKAHLDGTPAVNIHCAMHSYRWGEFKKPVEVGADNAAWFEMIGLQSTGHGPQFPIDVAYDKSHPITKALADWTTINEELYNNIQILPSAKAIATGKQAVKGKKDPADAPAKIEEAVVAWTSEYGPKKTRVFSTSLGHNNDTVADGRYLDLVCRGILWTTGHLDEAGKPTPGFMLDPPQP
jgi:type 1 glutamine amidotransferase